MGKKERRIGEMLIEAGIIDALQLNAALGHQKQWGGKLGSALIQMGFVNELSIANVLEKQLGEKCISLENKEISPRALNAVKAEIAKKYHIMPLDIDKNVLTIAIADPTDVKTIDDLSFMLGVRIKPVLALESDIKSAIEERYDGIPRSAKMPKIDIQRTTEKMQLMTEAEFSPEFQHEPVIEMPPAMQEEKKEITSNVVVEALVTLLIEKGIITQDELILKLKTKSKRS